MRQVGLPLPKSTMLVCNESACSYGSLMATSVSAGRNGGQELIGADTTSEMMQCHHKSITKSVLDGGKEVEARSEMVR